MKKAHCILLIAATCIGIAPSASAAQFPLTADLAVDLPLIPLEKSLIPCEQTTELGAEASTVLSATANLSEQVNASQELANALVRGLLIANRIGEISYRAPLSYRVQDVVRSLRRGESLSRASASARVPQTTLTRLLSLGKPGTSAARWLGVPPTERIILSHTLANAIVRGLLVANRTGEIAYAAPLSYRVQNVVRGLRRGEPLASASLRARVPLPVVSHLLQLGNYDEVPVN
jgi:hypothetical protein